LFGAELIRLKSDRSYVMVIEARVTAGEWQCRWMDAKGHAQIGYFKEPALVQVPCPDPKDSGVQFSF
jgi:uncharacterized protein YodC (DUF2158 family)